MARYTQARDGKDRTSAFWAWILGIAILGLVVWGIFEIFDNDADDVGVGGDQIGLIEDRPEEVEVAPYGREVTPGEERAEIIP